MDKKGLIIMYADIVELDGFAFYELKFTDEHGDIHMIGLLVDSERTPSVSEAAKFVESHFDGLVLLGIEDKMNRVFTASLQGINSFIERVGGEIWVDPNE